MNKAILKIASLSLPKYDQNILASGATGSGSNNSPFQLNIPDHKYIDVWIFNTSFHFVPKIRKTTDGYYIVNSEYVKNGCNNPKVPDKSKCILKIGNLFVSPQSALTGLIYIDATAYCNQMTTKKVGGWRLPSAQVLHHVLSKYGMLYNIPENTYFWTSDKYHNQHYATEWRNDGEFRTDTWHFDAKSTREVLCVMWTDS